MKTVQTAVEAYYAKNGSYPAGTDTAALNAAMTVAPNKFMNSALGAGSPSIDAGYAYHGGGDYSGGTCPA